MFKLNRDGYVVHKPTSRVFSPTEQSELRDLYDAWLAEGNTPEPAPTDPVFSESELKSQRVGQIKSALAALDQKKIRPMAEGDATFLASLNTQTAVLRDELKGLL
jgi:lysylphosphatidylglycerol synthetase-like protein (DUF2156 family)